MNYYHARQGADIAKLEALDWFGVPWYLLREARSETLEPQYITDTVDKGRFILPLNEKIQGK